MSKRNDMYVVIWYNINDRVTNVKAFPLKALADLHVHKAIRGLLDDGIDYFARKPRMFRYRNCIPDRFTGIYYNAPVEVPMIEVKISHLEPYRVKQIEETYAGKVYV